MNKLGAAALRSLKAAVEALRSRKDLRVVMKDIAPHPDHEPSWDTVTFTISPSKSVAPAL